MALVYLHIIGSPEQPLPGQGAPGGPGVVVGEEAARHLLQPPHRLAGHQPATMDHGHPGKVLFTILSCSAHGVNPPA